MDEKIEADFPTDQREFRRDAFEMLRSEKITVNATVIFHRSAQSKIISTNNRSSKFRGVSMNGKKFQVITFNSGVRYYLGTFEDETLAAIIFDIWQI